MTHGCVLWTGRSDPFFQLYRLDTGEAPAATAINVVRAVRSSWSLFYSRIQVGRYAAIVSGRFFISMSPGTQSQDTSSYETTRVVC